MENVLLENKLSTKERNNLSNNDFGLPDERKFPLIDENHIQKAIQFFKYCEPSKRIILANNINKKVRKLGLKIKISKDNLFYKLADKQILSESIVLDYISKDVIVDNDCNTIFMNINDFIIENTNELNELENKLQTIYIPQLIELCKKGINDGRYLINPISELNKMMRENIKQFDDYVQYNFDCYRPKKYNMVYEITEDLFFCLDNAISNISNKNYDLTEVNKYLDILKEFIILYMDNKEHILRKIDESIFNCFITGKYEDIKGPDKANALIKISKALTELETAVQKNEGNCIIVNNADDYIKNLPLSIQSTNTENYLNTIKNELKFKINIIILSNNIQCNLNDNKNFFLDFVPRGNLDMFNIIDYLTGALNPESLLLYDPCISTNLNEKDILNYQAIKYFKNIYPSKDRNNDSIYFGVDEDKLYLLCKNIEENDELILLKLFDGVSLQLEINLIGVNSAKNKLKFTVIKLRNTQEDYIEKVTEGIDVDKEGNVKFIIKPRKSFMDEYSENHKMIIANFKAGNFDAMKRNLAFLFAMITAIERDIIHGNKKVSEDKRKDAIKARMFAINDFKTYLKELQQKEKGFDFSKYYEENNFDNLILTVTPDNISGIKKLFRLIMLS